MLVHGVDLPSTAPSPPVLPAGHREDLVEVINDYGDEVMKVFAV